MAVVVWDVPGPSFSICFGVFHCLCLLAETTSHSALDDLEGDPECDQHHRKPHKEDVDLELHDEREFGDREDEVISSHFQCFLLVNRRETKEGEVRRSDRQLMW